MELLLPGLFVGALAGGIVALGLWLDRYRPDARTPIAFLTLLFWGVPAWLLVGALLITDRRPKWLLPVDAAAVSISAASAFLVTYQALEGVGA
jgi:hypothetical protein